MTLVLMTCDDNIDVDDDDDDDFSPDDDDVTITHYIPFFERIQQMDEQCICLLLRINCMLIELTLYKCSVKGMCHFLLNP